MRMLERYNHTVRHEWLDMHEFNTIEEAQNTATTWLWTYNNERPNMGIGGITPAMKLAQTAKLKPSTFNPANYRQLLEIFIFKKVVLCSHQD